MSFDASLATLSLPLRPQRYPAQSALHATVALLNESDTSHTAHETTQADDKTRAGRNESTLM